MSFVARVSIAIALATSIAATGTAVARADEGAKTDPRDVRGSLDIISVSQAHVGGSLVHALRVRRPFRSRLLTGSNAVAFTFDVNDDGRVDRLVLVFWLRKALRGALVDAKGHLIAQVPASRPDARTVRVTVPDRAFGDAESYRWLGFTTFKDKRICRRACTDIAPNAGPMVQRLPHESLDVSVSGSGRVTSEPRGIDCPAACSTRLPQGAPVTLTPAPAENWVFAGWSGACSGTGACNVRMDAAKAVTATFVPTYVLTVSVSGPGWVGVNPPDRPCPGANGLPCSFRYRSGTTVVLTAQTGPGYAFDGWTGACAGSGPTCTLALDADMTVGAMFSIRSFTLSVSIGAQSGASGRVTSNLAGIDCPGDCSESYTAETWITLTATPTSGSVFDGWTDGFCRGLNPSCILVMGAITPTDKAVTATFRAVS
jgi:uncharacterized repeat protein (TIGR02543 family)